MKCLSEAEFKDEVFDYDRKGPWSYSGKLPAIVDFYADWCGPCRVLGPIIEEVSKEYADKVKVFKVNIDQSPEVARAFGISSVPSLMFVPREGKPQMAVGVLPKATIKRAIGDVLGVRE